jgi:hypothetical protein
MNFRMLTLATALSSLVLPYAASQTVAPALAASALTAVPPLVPYSGQVEGRTGEATATFLIYKEQAGGEPLFTESQIVSFDPSGRYKIQLGAANPNGLPPDLFATGEARWLEVQIAGEKAEPRVLLASVPYALKAADAATLGGFPASAFALAGNRAVSNPAIVNETAGIVPDTASTVTTTGGTASKLAKFSGSNTIVNSILYDNGTQVGIGTTSPTATLTVAGTATVNGASTLNGGVMLPAQGTATASKGFSSQFIKLSTSAYNSSSKAVVAPRFQLMGEVTGNDTDSPNATLNLLASSGPSAPAETGLSINTDGTINFAPGQTFQGDTTVEGNTTIAPGVVGYSTGNSGVSGISTSAVEDNAGVVGANVNASGAGVGVSGEQGNISSTGANYRSYGLGAGVWGDSSFPISTVGTAAVVGTADDQFAGVFEDNSEGATTLSVKNYANSTAANVAWMGGINGGCLITTSGDFYCDGSKSAVVPVDDNTRKVALYAVESPENWFEDFGSGELSNGVATVKLEPVFAQTVNLGADYHVFLTPNGDSRGLYISRKTPTSFEVRESGGGSSTLAFDYRILARRKGYETIRLADKTKDLERSRSPLMMSARQSKKMKP